MQKRRASPGDGRPYQRRQDGRWVVVVRDPDENRVYLYAWSRSEAIVRRDDYRAAARLGVRLAPARLTVGRQLDDWLADRRGKVGPSTWVSYEGHVRIHLATLSRIPMVKLTPADVRRLIRDRESEGCSPATIGHTLTVLRMALRQAVADGILPRNVATLVAPPKVRRVELDVYTKAEVRELLRPAAAADPLGALWEVLVGTGARLGEALALRWSDVDAVAGDIRVTRSLRAIGQAVRAEGEPRLQAVAPKTDESRRGLVVPDVVFAALQRHRAAAAATPRNVAGLVFTTPRGTALDPRNVSRAWDRFVATAGLRRIRIHDLRHTAATIALGEGASLEDVKRMLGHTSIRQTSDTYGHLVRERQREVASLMNAAMGGAG